MFGFDESWKAQGMAEAVGVNLAASALDGFLTRADLAAFAARCRACAEGALCGRLAARARDQGVLPGRCGNRADPEGLRGT